MKLQRFEVPGLAHYSYLLASDGKAVVIDPKRDVGHSYRCCWKESIGDVRPEPAFRS